MIPTTDPAQEPANLIARGPIYTSYWAKVQALELNNVVPIGISLYPPRWFNGVSYNPLAPTRYIKDLAVEKYIPEFNSKILAKLDPHDVVADLYALSHGKPFAMLCYEKPEDFCHRQLVADWLRQAGYDCSEYVFPAFGKKKTESRLGTALKKANELLDKGANQLSLF